MLKEVRVPPLSVTQRASHLLKKEVRNETLIQQNPNTKESKPRLIIKVREFPAPYIIFCSYWFTLPKKFSSPESLSLIVAKKILDNARKHAPCLSLALSANPQVRSMKEKTDNENVDLMPPSPPSRDQEDQKTKAAKDNESKPKAKKKKKKSSKARDDTDKSQSSAPKTKKKKKKASTKTQDDGIKIETAAHPTDEVEGSENNQLQPESMIEDLPTVSQKEQLELYGGSVRRSGDVLWYHRSSGEDDMKEPTVQVSPNRREMEKAKQNDAGMHAVRNEPAEKIPKQEFVGAKAVSEGELRKKGTIVELAPGNYSAAHGSAQEQPTLQLASSDYVQPPELRRNSRRYLTDSSPGAFRVEGLQAPLRSESPVTTQLDDCTRDEENPEGFPEIVAELALDPGEMVHALVQERLQEERKSQVVAHAVVEKRVCGFPKRAFFLVVFGIILVIVAISISLGLFVGRKSPNVPAPEDTAHPNLAPTFSPSLGPSMLPTSSPAPTISRESALMDILIGANASSHEVLTSGNIFLSAVRAFNWLANTDTARLDFSRANKDIIVERYAMATFYFDTKGQFWKNRTLFLSNSSVCDWFGITCNQFDRITHVNLREYKTINNCALSSLHFVTYNALYFYTVDNNLQGSIASEIGLLSQLEDLTLSENPTLLGLPSEIGMLTRLSQIVVENASLQSLPIELYYLTKLEEIKLTDNKFEGTLPTEIGLLTNLKEFAANQGFRGTLPSEIGNMKNLEDLYLHTNDLTGTVPTEFANLQNMKELLMYNNSLTGSVDSIFCTGNGFNNLDSLEFDCGGSPPQITCSCCRVCWKY